MKTSTAATLARLQKETLSEAQLTSILDKVVPMVAAPADHEFFRGVLAVKLGNSTPAQAAAFIARLLKAASAP